MLVSFATGVVAQKALPGIELKAEVIAAARSSVIQIGSCASLPSGWRTVRATSSPCRLRPLTITVSRNGDESRNG
jgi:hypothetical protein